MENLHTDVKVQRIDEVIVTKVKLLCVMVSV